MFNGSTREKFFYHNTLLCLVRALEGKITTVDLRNDTYVCGEIMSVDGYMNLSFKNAVYCDPQSNEFFFEQLFIQGRNIRYVHIPETIPIISTIKSEVVRNKLGRPNTKSLTEKTRKTKKALKQHMQIVASLDDQT